MTQPYTISIAIPVYNGADYLREALDSVAAQTDQDFELVVSDNCSTDATPRILEEFALSRTNVVVSRSERFISQGDNTNRVVSLCSGSWVKFLCHDDLLDPECIATLRKALSDIDASRVGVIAHDEQWLFSNGYLTAVTPSEPSVSTWNGKEFLRGHFGKGGVPIVPSLTTAMVNRRAFEESDGFDPRYVRFDTFYWLRLMLKWDYVYMNRVLTVNRIHGAQVAVAARHTVNSVFKDAGFWPEFIAEAQRAGLDLEGVWRLKLKPIALAASYVGIELLLGERRNAWTMMRQLPLHWWPLMPPLVLRAYHRERNRTRELARQVPLRLIYP